MDDTPIASSEPDAEARGKRVPAGDADPYDFGAAEEALNDAAKRVNAVWISFIVLCVYIFIATFTVTSAMLFRDAPVKLPIFNADLPLRVYFVMAPVLILALHAYLIVLTKGLAEKVDAYEEALHRSTKIASDRRALRGRLDNSINLRAMHAGHGAKQSGVDHACALISGVTMNGLPVLLLLLTQLIFLPYQDEWMTWAQRSFVFVDVAMCAWALWPRTPWLLGIRRIFFTAFNVFAVATAILAAFPGERLYEALSKTRARGATVWAFEGSADPVDYVRHGSDRWFPNRLILPDDPKLAEAAGAPSGGASLSARGRNFRKAVFDRSNLARVDFSAADLTEASLKGTNLEGAKFECATSGSFNIPPYSMSKIVKWVKDRDCSKLNDANLSTATLDAAVFIGATLMGARFQFAHGHAVDFSSALLVGADFQNAQLRAAKFENAALQGSRLSNSDLQAVDFLHAYMQGVDMNSASLQGASFEKTFLHAATLYGVNMQGASFKGAVLRDASFMCAELFRTDFENADLARTIMILSAGKRCETGLYTESIIGIYDPDDFLAKYNLSTDSLPTKHDDNIGSTDIYQNPSYDDTYTVNTFTPIILTHPQTLDSKTFERQLSDFVLLGLPNDEAKKRVRDAFERLKPGARTKVQDDAEKAFWVAWNKQSAKPDSHDEALAQRLESVACVGEGAPYVARGLLRAGRFDLLRVSEKMNDEEKGRIKRINERNLEILERLKHASKNGGSNCPGAIGLVEADFPKPAPTK